MNSVFPFIETNPHTDSALILAAGRQLFSGAEPKWVWARSLGRFGYSGARLYVVRVSFDAAPFNHQILKPFAVKIASIAKIKKEFLPYPRIGTKLDFQMAHVELPDHQDAALAVTLHADKTGQVTELRDLLFPSDQSTHPIDAFTAAPATLFEQLYTKCIDAMHSSHKLSEVSWELDYAVCDSVHTKVVTRLNGMFGADYVKRSNPEGAFKQKMTTTASLLRGEIHGDLHPSNVVLDRDLQKVHLIDFADSVEEGHLLKDFVLMECSVRFHRFPRSVNFTTQRNFDKKFAKCDFAFESALGQVQNCRLSEHYERLANYVAAIRQAAKTRTEQLRHEWSGTVYRTALFLQLYKQMQYESYGHSAGEALLQMAKSLKK